MNSINKQTVSIEIGTTMFARYADLPNTVSHAIAEFIDNALQSYRDSKEILLANNPDFKFRITIDFEWNSEDNRAKVITISDNAGGLNFRSFQKAFMTAETPEDNKGLNEFGMGMKTAAGWLGNIWSVRTTAIGEPVERFYEFNLQYVLDNDVKELPYKEVACSNKEHYTIVTIKSPTKNSPSNKSSEKIKTELASIYRQSLRVNEMELFVNGDSLSFEEYPVLEAPFVRPQNGGHRIYWKKNIDFKFGKYRAKGFIAILKDINNTQNGLVLLRRGRVIVGAETDGRYFPKSLFGSQGNFRFKRLFGELELDGFEVSFNKNDIQDKENLEALMEALKGEIHTKQFDLYTQAEEYRVDENRKIVKKLVRRHDTSAKANRKPIDIFTPKPVQYTIPDIETLIVKEPTVLDGFEDTYKIKGISYTLSLQYVEGTGDDLCWVDVSNKSRHEIICKIDVNHIFFQHFGKPSDAITAILKTIAIAKFTAKEEGNDTAGELLTYFNKYIKETKV